ncbi:hypothetical protein Q8F55_007575 [Vanrija albida]|uniref:Uncharacterized protein n=1 Tax=Vanrija albida TaxID=181172 RepID=A0ABR3PTX3_9TREE
MPQRGDFTELDSLLDALRKEYRETNDGLYNARSGEDASAPAGDLLVQGPGKAVRGDTAAPLEGSSLKSSETGGAALSHAPLRPVTHDQEAHAEAVAAPAISPQQGEEGVDRSGASSLRHHRVR